MKTAYCAYPPQLAPDVEVAEQHDSQRPSFIVGSASAGRFILLGENEHRVLQLLGEGQPPAGICAEFSRRYGGVLPLATLTRFLAKLDETGILAGERARLAAQHDTLPGSQFYWRFSLFNPDRLLTRLAGWLSWIWTPGFVIVTGLLAGLAGWLALLNASAIADYAIYTLGEHYVALFVVGWLIVLTHEFAHGLTCKAFGGRVPELGVMMIYYVLPALYCNVSGIHMIPERHRRLWVIASGVYWQLLAGAVSLLFWFVLEPYTLLSDMAFILFLAGVVDVIFNANPLIKLDGYYFLTQFLRFPNLLDRSRAYWRRLIQRALADGQPEPAVQQNGRERTILFTFGLASFLYTVGLRAAILIYGGSYLMDHFHVAGLVMTLGLAAFYLRSSLGVMGRAIARWCDSATKSFFRRRMERNMPTNNEPTAELTLLGSQVTAWVKSMLTRRRLLPLSIALIAIAILCLPWNSSVGNYGRLIPIPGQETIIRAPESATLVALEVHPGEQVAAGMTIGRMGDLELDDQALEVRAELERARSEYERLLGETRMHEEATTRARLLLRQAEYDFSEIDSEQQQIDRRRHADDLVQQVALTDAVHRLLPSGSESRMARYPAAISVLQSEADDRRLRLIQAETDLDRLRRLEKDGIVARKDLEAAETLATTLAIAHEASLDRLDAALVEHRRRHKATTTDLYLAGSDVDAAALQVEKLGRELTSIRALMGSLEARRDLLERRRGQFLLVTPRAGNVFGEDLPLMLKRHFRKGEEICRIADTHLMLVRVQVSEREIGEVRLGRRVRLKTASFPDKTFYGTVSKIGSESEKEESRRSNYRVELTIENSDGSLRPGMTAFARIDSGRRRLGGWLLYKTRRALRPELWIF